MNSDVLIVGGGLIGLAIARELVREGAGDVTILEKGEIGGEASFAAAGMLAPNAETTKVDAFFGLCSESNRLYDDFAGELKDETGVDIELDSSGTLYVAMTENDSRELAERFTWQRSAELPVERLSARETRAREPFLSPDVRESLFFPEDRQVENRKLVRALHVFAIRRRIGIYENTTVDSLIVDNGVCAGVRTANGDFSAGTVVVAAGAWSSQFAAEGVAIPRVTPVRGQMIAFQTAKRLFASVIYSPRGYLVPRADGRLLAGATVEDAGFDNSVTSAGIEFLHDNALEIAPSLINLPIAEKWSGLRPLGGDPHPVIGAIPGVDNAFIATAHYRNGILLAPVTAKILAEKIVRGVDSPHLTTFGPGRFPSGGLRSVGPA